MLELSRFAFRISNDPPVTLYGSPIPPAQVLYWLLNYSERERENWFAYAKLIDQIKPNQATPVIMDSSPIQMYKGAVTLVSRNVSCNLSRNFVARCFSQRLLQRNHFRGCYISCNSCRNKIARQFAGKIA